MAGHQSLGFLYWCKVRNTKAPDFTHLRELSFWMSHSTYCMYDSPISPHWKNLSQRENCLMKVITSNSGLKHFTSILADLNIFIFHLWIVYNVYILTLTTLHSIVRTCRKDLCGHADEGIWNHALHGNRNVELPRYVPVQAGLHALQLVAYVTEEENRTGKMKGSIKKSVWKIALNLDERHRNPNTNLAQSSNFNTVLRKLSDNPTDSNYLQCSPVGELSGCLSKSWMSLMAALEETQDALAAAFSDANQAHHSLKLTVQHV